MLKFSPATMKFGSCAIALVTWTAFASLASAAPFSYTLGFSADKSVLMGGRASAKTAHAWKVAMNTPTIKLTNTSDIGSITKFQLQLDPSASSVFDALAIVSGPPDVSCMSLGDCLHDGVTNDLLEIAFPTPLAPGQSLTLRVDIDPTAAMMAGYTGNFTDIFFQLDDNDLSNNAVSSVFFDGPGGNDPTITAALPDFTSGESFTNTGNGFFLTDNFTVRANCCCKIVGKYETGNMVPEPASIVMMGLGGMGLLACARRARRRAC